MRASVVGSVRTCFVRQKSKAFCDVTHHAFGEQSTSRLPRYVVAETEFIELARLPWKKTWPKLRTEESDGVTTACRWPVSWFVL